MCVCVCMYVCMCVCVCVWIDLRNFSPFSSPNFPCSIYLRVSKVPGYSDRFLSKISLFSKLSDLPRCLLLLHRIFLPRSKKWNLFGGFKPLTPAFDSDWG